MSENKVYRIMADGAYVELTPGKHVHSGCGFLVEKVDNKNGKIEVFSATYTNNHVQYSESTDRKTYEKKKREMLKFINKLIMRKCAQ